MSRRKKEEKARGKNSTHTHTHTHALPTLCRQRLMQAATASQQLGERGVAMMLLRALLVQPPP